MRSKLTGKLLPTVSANLAVAPIGGGGFVCGIDIHPSGQMAMGPDVVGVHVRKFGDKRWIPLINPKNLGNSNILTNITPGLSDSAGGGNRIAPSDPNTIYAYRGEWIVKTEDGGASFVPLYAYGNFRQLANNGAPRLHNRTIDVHPTDKNVFINGTTAQNTAPDDVAAGKPSTLQQHCGVFFSTDGGESPATRVAGLPNPTSLDGPGRYLVAIDPGQPNIAYAAPQGQGLWRCTTFPSATGWTKIADSPSRINQLTVKKNGLVCIACGGDGVKTNDVYLLARGASSGTFYSTNRGTGAQVVIVYGPTSNIFFASDADGICAITFNSGGSWHQYDGFDQPNPVVGSGEIGWLSDKGVKAIVPAHLIIDETLDDPQVMWCGQGLGVSWATLPKASGDPLVWHDYTAGQEEKISRSFLSVPGGRVFLGNWDYPICPVDSLEGYDNKPILLPQPGGGNGLSICTGMGYAQDDVNFLVASIAQTSRGNAFSPNGGRSWQIMPNQLDGEGWPYITSSIAVNRKDNIIILGGNDALSLFTTDGMETWDPVELIPGTPTTNLAANSESATLSADHERDGVFAIVAPTVYEASLGGLWVTKDGGWTWNRTIAGTIGSNLPGWSSDTNDPRQFGGGTLKYIPGFSGEMLYTPYGIYSGYPGDFLFWVKNDGEGGDVQRLGANVTQVVSFDFGPPLTPGGRPSLAFFGKVGGVPGLYFSEDWLASAPILLARHPVENLSGCGIVGCDKNIFGRVYAGRVGWGHTTLGQRLEMKAAA